MIDTSKIRMESFLFIYGLLLSEIEDMDMEQTKNHLLTMRDFCKNKLEETNDSASA